jgi:KipI family sensor histidine kinase inhibitor
MTSRAEPRTSLLGTDALLFDVGGPVFEDALQQRVWAVCDAAAELEGVREATPGMNNLMVVFDNRTSDPQTLTAELGELWARVKPRAGSGRIVEAPTVYGGEVGDELAELAGRAGLSVEETVRLHADQPYGVAAVGAMPGFVYLSGLDPRLAWPRRATPRARVVEGSVIIGGTQAGIMPCAAPTGWHSIGLTSLRLFDPDRQEPATLRPGDRLRFVVSDIRP